MHQTECVAVGAGNDGAASTTHTFTAALQITQKQHMFTRVSETQLRNESCLVVSG